MKNISIRLRTLFLGAVIVAAGACTDNYMDYNTKPDDAHIVSVDAMLIQMQDYVLPKQENSYQHGENLLGHVYGRYLGYANAAKWQTNFASYNASTQWLNLPFSSAFTKTYAAWNVIKRESGNNPVIFSWAQILRVAAMQRITDMYGPIPYSAMATADGSIAVKYDKQEDVYKQMIADLDEAINKLTAYVQSNPSDRSFKDTDQIYGGDFTQWVKFANSLKLRLAIHMIYADEPFARNAAKSAVNHSIGVVTGVADNAKIVCDKNPLYVMWDPYNDCRVAAEIVSYMRGYSDPRIGKYFQRGNYGGTPGYYGVRVGANTTSIDKTEYSCPAVQVGDPLLWLTAAEVAFLKAEGAINGWGLDVVGDTAENLYELGVKLSFEQWDAMGYDTYIADAVLTPDNYTDPSGSFSVSNPSTITIAWNDGAPFEEKLERLMTQKWIAMYPLGTEAWTDFRRTGYPRFFPVVDNRNTDGSLTLRNASRIPYPPAEQLNNTANLAQGIEYLNQEKNPADQGGDRYGTRLWWDKRSGKPNW